MKKSILALAAVVTMGMSSSVFGMSSEEANIIQKASDAYMSAVPESGYHILAETVLERIKSGKKDFVIVDVRMPKAAKYDKGHLPGAVYIGFREIAKLENLAKLPKDKDIIVHCDTGHEQNKVLSVLRMLGYNAYDMKWGFSSWKTAGPTGATLNAIEGSIVNNYPLEN